MIESPAAIVGGRRDWFAKACFDRIGAALLLVVSFPILALVALLVRITSRGPVVYRRRVVGLNGEQFDAFKFRTMVADADRILEGRVDLHDAYGQNIKLRDDPRRTAVGRWLRKLSLDELPQLLNVVRGEMSLVGPRMISPEEMPKFGAALQKRLSVKPGITGLWQISGRQDLDYATRIELDLQYIEQASLRLDVLILVKTIPAVLSMRGAY
ncbi:MAG: sugar transferase [Deltaproteobacteria bacterium]|nr:sugar transferase [Deltaproteobacteria bacterium]